MMYSRDLLVLVRCLAVRGSGSGADSAGAAFPLLDELGEPEGSLECPMGA